MSANGSSVVISPVVQGKDQKDILANMQNHNMGNSTSLPVTGSCFNGGSFLSWNSINPPAPQVPNHSTIGT
ncbi:hypothetical protein E2562_013683 [Oryza meyeriana var. granulata]|uniref:Uncharacterized protein n=1 Tax=Oryza meyeriana var. granulata TaxID=110450 RepID=A0A6G1BJK7_9ORYZ|nr:hypothetical protein E2562_013683 [Oryza meyeriana var. granulata]